MGNKVDMTVTQSGHYSLVIEHPKPNTAYFTNNTVNSDDTIQTYINLVKEPLNLKDVQKLHHYFGHVPKRKLEELIRISSKWTGEVKTHLEHIKSHYRSCKTNQKAKPLPTVLLPRSSGFNDVVTLDLKEYNEGSYRYILYMVALFSPLTVGTLINNKKTSTVGAEIMTKWVVPWAVWIC